jgi:hypothetical protein
MCEGRALASGDAIEVMKLGNTPVGPMIDDTSASSGSSALRSEHPADGDGVFVEWRCIGQTPPVGCSQVHSTAEWCGVEA